MNPLPNRRRSALAASLCFPRAGWLALSLALAGIGAKAAPDAPPGEPKPLTLYSGADFYVHLGKDVCPVVDLANASFVVEDRDHLVKVPMNRGPVNIRARLALKLTDSAATITDLKKDRAYSQSQDPWSHYSEELESAEGAAYAFNNSQNQNSPIMQDARNGLNGSGAAAVRYTQTQAIMSQQAEIAPPSTLTDPGEITARAQEEDRKELYDAMQISFQVSSARPLEDPYLLIIVRYRGPKEPATAAHDWICAVPLEPIDSHPHRVFVRQGGFTPGYHYDLVQIHLYNHGREVSTSLSEHRLPLTRKEAFEYLLINYLGAHKGATGAAAPVLGRLTADQSSRLGAAQASRVFFVKVTKDGLPGPAYLDQGCTSPVTDPSLCALIAQVRFVPALDRGKPVDGVAPLNFSQLDL